MPKPSPVKNPVSALVDELGDLEKRLAPWKKKISRADALRKLIRLSCADLPAAEGTSLYGAKYVAVVEPRQNVQTVNVVKLSTLISSRAFNAVASVTLGAIEDLAPEVQAAVIESALTGSRPLTVFPKV